MSQPSLRYQSSLCVESNGLKIPTEKHLQNEEMKS